ncbi:MULTISPECIES: tyrosine-type recombinase/integrase [unclassified Paraburkholderia]|uniref:tyrosine-type recombinase/integrase n=1 Tax=unclassified Paraburkholderia TaxID=2615204 RepID=UPI002AB263E6|nr:MULTISPECIES: tyrosine-type recombinase/integrase [unclassified Paraburkholderia]
MAQQGQLFEELDSGDEPGMVDLAPSRDDWLRLPAQAFEAWVLNIATSDGKSAYSDQSIKQYRSMFNAFARYLVERRTTVLSVGPAGVRDFLADLKGRDPGEPGVASEERKAKAHPAQRSTIKRHADLIDDVMKHLVARGYRKSNPVFDATRQRVGRRGGPRTVCMPTEVDERLQEYLLHEMDASTWAHRRDRALLLLLIGSGITGGQAGRARISQFVFDDVVPSFDCIPDPDEEIGGYRAVLAPFCVEIVRQWVDERARGEGAPKAAEKDIVFPGRGGPALSNVSVWQTVRAALKAIGFHGDDMGPRVLRTTYARRQLLAGATIEEVAALLGVENTTIIKRLVRMTPTRSGYVPV